MKTVKNFVFALFLVSAITVIALLPGNKIRLALQRLRLRLRLPYVPPKRKRAIRTLRCIS